MSEWQTIESAPKGDVLLYWPAVFKRDRKTHDPMVAVGHADGTPFRRPSHWMPLPKPPKESGK